MAILSGKKVKLFSLNSNKELAEEIAKYMHLELSKCQVNISLGTSCVPSPPSPYSEPGLPEARPLAAAQPQHWDLRRAGWLAR